MDDKNPLSDSEEKLVLELSGPAMMVGAGMHLLQALGQGRAKEERERAVGPLNGSVLQFSQCEWGQNHSIKHLPLPSIPRPSAYNFQPHFPVSLFSFFPFFCLPVPLADTWWGWRKSVTFRRHESLRVLIQAFIISKLATELPRGNRAWKGMWRIFQSEFCFSHWC